LPSDRPRPALPTLGQGTTRALLLATALALSMPVGAATERLDDGAWSAAIPDDPAEPCELTTGGFDHAAGEQDPLLLIGIERSDPAAPLRVTVQAPTDLTPPELLEARATLGLNGPGGRTVPLFPTAIIDAERARLVAFRPQLSGGEQAGLRALIDGLRQAERAEVKLNGRALEPAFALRGLDALWQRVAARCGVGGG
jgi:hypothetical protein